MFEKISTKVKEKFKNFVNIALFLLVIFLAISLIRTAIRTQSARSQIEEAKEKVDKLKEENRKLEEKLKEVQNQVYIEKQIRDKLGLAKKGEIIVVLPDAEILRKLAPEIPEEEETLPDPIWKKWLKLFF